MGKYLKKFFLFLCAFICNNGSSGENKTMLNKNAFKTLLAQEESGNSYIATNPSGALGKYQFMPTTLNGLQNLYSLPAWLNAENFLSNPQLQERYFDAHILDLTKFYNNTGLSRYEGRTITGSKRYAGQQATLNIHGIFAGMHLAGSGAIKRYFETGYNPDDGLTSLSDYMVFFSNNIGGNPFNMPISSIVGIVLMPIIVYFIASKY